MVIGGRRSDREKKEASGTGVTWVLPIVRLFPGKQRAGGCKPPWLSFISREFDLSLIYLNGVRPSESECKTRIFSGCISPDLAQHL
jgi:hypothetical protein